MSYPISQQDYSIIKQSYRNMFVKVELLNFQLSPVDNIEGVILNGTINIDADADIRRTCTLTMVIPDDSFKIEIGGKLWLDKYIKIYVGTEDIYTNEIAWVNMGVYMINNPDHVFDDVTNTITFQGVDLMAKMTGMRNGYLEGIPTKIEVGASIRDAMIAALALAGFKKHIVADNPQTVPYEILIDRGGTVFDILRALRDISPEYEMFFDIDGTFRYQKITTGEGDAIFIDNDVLDNTLLSISNQVNFEDVKNKIEVWGKSLDPQWFGGDATVSGSEYSVKIDGLDVLEKNIMIGFVAPTIVPNPTLKINSFAAQPLVDEDGTPAILPLDKQYYVIRVREDGKFLYMGKQQISAVISDENPDSPYYIGSTIGEILIPLFGGEYDNIVTDDLAMQRAKYELYLRARLPDAITVTSTIIPWIDVNMKMSYSNAENKIKGEFLVKSASLSLDIGGTMTFTACRFYPLYPIL